MVKAFEERSIKISKALIVSGAIKKKKSFSPISFSSFFCPIGFEKLYKHWRRGKIIKK